MAPQVHSSYASKRARRPHRKSRLGCSNCKARKIKCDELKPTCTQCLHRPTECHYMQDPKPDGVSKQRDNTSSEFLATQIAPPKDVVFISSSQSSFAVPKRAHRKAEEQQEPSPSNSSSEAALAQKQFEFTAVDMVLFHHCCSADDLKNYIPNELLRLGFSSHFLLRLFLAVAGFHLNRTLEPEHIGRVLGPNVDFYAEAERHLQLAIAKVATTPLLTPSNSHVLYAASVYIFICSLARGPRPDEYFAFRVDNDKPSLCLFLGLRTILEDCNERGMNSKISSMHPDIPENADTGTHPDHNQGSAQLSHPTYRACHEYSEPLRNLQIHIYSTFSTGSLRDSSYCHVFQSLVSRYDSIYGGSAPLSGEQLWPLIFSWLYTLPDCIVRDLEGRHPVALLLFGFFVVLLHELDAVWFIHGWPQHILRGIYHQLDGIHRALLGWPLSCLGLSDCTI